MNVLLINPQNTGYYYKLGAFYPPLGMAYISSYLKKHGHNVKMVDMNAERFNYKDFDYSQFELVGISTDTVRFPLVVDISRYVKKCNVPLVLGGPHAAADYERILRDNIADYVVFGEGEIPTCQLASELEKGNRYPELDGLAYSKDGSIVSKKQDFIKDLDNLPFPDRDGLPLNNYKSRFDKNPATSIITSRGCPFNCEFCSASQFMGMRWRKRSNESVLEEIKLLVKKYGYKSIIFFDDNFTLDPKRAIDISEKILKNDLKISWWAFSRADEVVYNEEMLEALSRAGCKMLFIGFENINDEILEEFNKKLSASIASSVVEKLKKFNIDTFASFIMGGLKDTKDNVVKNMKFAKKLGAEIVQFSILTPYPGTRLFTKLKDKLFKKSYEYYDGTHLVFQHPNFNSSQLRRLFMRAYYYIYTEPKKLFKRGLPFFWRMVTSTTKNKIRYPLEVYPDIKQS
jgi:anaerobic magnesium-protoporphyrin IX monomethyl ester cyclase